jgi:16S rRNA (adenine1518-N6/adenine1519-N6)-dimethyltransferase
MTHRAKKSLGQHFLRSNSAIKAMVSAGKVTAGDTVLEIGPGEGVLTHALLEAGAKVIAVEFDHDLIPNLQDRFVNEIASGKLHLIEADIMKFNLLDHKLQANNYKLVANIPYYITGAIFEKFLTEKNHPSCLVVLIQKEVATRIVARDGKQSILSLSVKAFGIPKIVVKVPASAFRPAPKVDSAVLLVSDISQKNFQSPTTPSRVRATPPQAGGDIKHFFDVIHAGFAHKRKLIVRNLEKIATRDSIASMFSSLNIPEKARAEDLTLETWLSIAKTLNH